MFQCSFKVLIVVVFCGEFEYFKLLTSFYKGSNILHIEVVNMENDINFEHEDRKQQGSTKRTIEEVHDDTEPNNEQNKKIKSENIESVNDVILPESLICDEVKNEKSDEKDIEENDVEKKDDVKKGESVEVCCLLCEWMRTWVRWWLGRLAVRIPFPMVSWSFLMT